ncbi:type VI secretion system Vgr family protein [Paralcaligenes ginsengisoli]
MAEEHNFKFQCEALESQLSGHHGVVTHWTGTEAVSRPYRFEVTLALKERKPELELEKLLDQAATLTARKPDGSRSSWSGIITQVSQDGCDDVYDFYKVVLEPRLVRLRSWQWSDIYLDKQLDDIIVQLLKQIGLIQPYTAGAAYDYRILASNLAATKQEFVCQFEENCLDFLMRQLEFYGVYFWFEQAGGQESVVFANDASQQPQEAITAVFYPKGELNTEAKEIAIKRLNRQIGLHPKTVTLHTSPVYDNTTINLTSTASVSEPINSQGERHRYDDQFEHLDGNNDTSGAALAKWRAEEALCQSLHVNGESRTPGLGAGRALTVYEYHRQSSAKDYYIVEISHRGHQALETSEDDDEPPYRGHFVALPRWQNPVANKTPLQFRPPRTTPVPEITRVVNGFIDTGTADTDTVVKAKRYAQTDDLGRYKVRFCFIRQQYKGTRNSAWVRMATPYAGGASSKDLTPAGMHFPLREGTEVLISFINGDPNRPVIMSALPNSEAPSVVNSKNTAEHLVVTPAGNMLALRDSAADAGNTATGSDPAILLSSPTEESALNLGKSDQSSVEDGFNLRTAGHGQVLAGDSIWINVPGHLSIKAGSNALEGYLDTIAKGLPPGISMGAKGGLAFENFLGAKFESVEGIKVGHFLGAKAEFMEGISFETKVAASGEYKIGPHKDFSNDEITTYGEHTFNFGTATWTGGNWIATIADKQENVDTSNTKATGTYLVASPDITLSAGTTDFSLTPATATLDSTGDVSITGAVSTTVLGEAFKAGTVDGTTFFAAGMGEASLIAPLRVTIVSEASVGINGESVMINGTLVELA